MLIKDLKDLKKVMQLCRSQGVDIIKIDNVEIVLGKEPVSKLEKGLMKGLTESVASQYSLSNITEDIQIPTEGPTEEQLLFGSSDPTVWDDKQPQ